MGERETGIRSNRILELRARLPVGLLVLRQIVQGLALQIGFVGACVARSAWYGRVRRHLDRQGVRNGSCDLALERKYVIEPPLDLLRPLAESGPPVGEARRDPDRVA